MRTKAVIAVSIALISPVSLANPLLSLINPADNSLYQLSVTPTSYHHSVDYQQKINAELGSGWAVADWRAISANAGSNTSSYALAEFMRGNILGGPRSPGAEAGTYFVYRDGQKYAYQSPGFSRAYFATAHYQQKPGYYLAHENINNHMISLGSWETNAQIMAARTVATPRLASDYRIVTTSYSPSNSFGNMNSFDPSLPTVVYTHGFNRGLAFGEDAPREDEAAAGIVSSFLQAGKGVNLISYQWKDGFSNITPSANVISAVSNLIGDMPIEGSKLAKLGIQVATNTVSCVAEGAKCNWTSFVPAIGTSLNIENAKDLVLSEIAMRAARDNAGLQLAAQLKTLLPDGYSKDVQFVGFGDGAAVTTFALRTLSKSAKSDITTGHIGFSSVAIPIKDADFELRIPSGFLDSVESYGLNSPYFKGADRYSLTRFDANTTDSQWVWHAFATNAGVTVPAWLNPSAGILIPVDILNTPRFNQGTVTDINSLHGQVFDGFTLKENSPSSTSFLLNIPVDATALLFDYFVSNPGDGDWFSVYFNDQLLWSILGSSFLGDNALTALLDISDFAGETGTLMFALHSVGASSAEASFGNLRFETTTVPEPASFALLAMGLLWLASTNRKANPRSS